MIPSRAYPPMVDPALSESLRVASTAAEALKKLDIDVFAARARRGQLGHQPVAHLLRLLRKPLAEKRLAAALSVEAVRHDHV